MSKFKFDKLVVLHFYNYSRPKSKGEPDPLKIVVQESQIVKLSTCMRTIYLSTADSLQEGVGTAYESLVKHVEQNASKIVFKRLQGLEAYEFLLYWMIGGLNPRIPFADLRIRGDVRSVWETILKGNDPTSKQLTSRFTQFFDQFFTDSAKVGKVRDDLRREQNGNLANIMKMVCEHCAWTRFNGFLVYVSAFNYRHFIDDSYIQELKVILLKAEKRLLDKSILSPANEGFSIVFFKSNYEITPEKLEKITERLLAYKSLLNLLEHVKPKLEVERDLLEVEADINQKSRGLMA